MKIRPIQAYHRETGRAGIVGTMAADSNARRKMYLTHGCYLGHLSVPRATPLGFWLDRDIWEYLRTHSVPYCSVYDLGVHHTGCMFCMFGIAQEKSPNRFELMAKTHPSLHAYCMDKLGLRDVLNYLSIPTGCERPTEPQSVASAVPDMPLLASVSS